MFDDVIEYKSNNKSMRCKVCGSTKFKFIGNIKSVSSDKIEQVVECIGCKQRYILIYHNDIDIIDMVKIKKD